MLWIRSRSPQRISGILLIAAWSLTQLDAATSRGEEPWRQGGLEVVPSRVLLVGGEDAQQLAVTTRGSDGAELDVTSECSFCVEPPAIARVSATGLVEAVADGTGELRIRHQSGTATLTIEVRRTGQRRPASYRNDVVPLLTKGGCNSGACHGGQSGKGGLKLSLRGEDPEFDLRVLTREAGGRRLSVASARQSLVLLKPTGQVPHEGGIRFAAQSRESAVLADWIAAGAVDDAAVVPPLRTLQVFPSERICSSASQAQQLVVVAEFADGSRRDVTRQASYDLNDPTLADVSEAGLVRPRGRGELAVAVRYREGRAVSRLAFLQPRSNWVWNPPPPANLVDQHVYAKLQTLRIHPADLASDPVFLRRVFLDTIGRLPSVEEARTFLQDPDPTKRSRWIDQLLERPEFADFWALKWADLLRNEEKTMGEKGVWVFQRWLRDQFAADVPLDRIVRNLVSGRGSTHRNPAASFHRTNRDPLTAAETVAQVFLGIRIQCARCHNHPFDDWTQDDYYGLAACFSNLKRKQVANLRRDRFDSHEINGDEVVYLSGSPGLTHPRTRAQLRPTPLGGEAVSPETPDALEPLARWLTEGNRQFARNLANRIWFQLMGRGIVEPVDDFRPSNPPSNPALLEALTDQLEAGGMRLKPLVGLILKSTTYQLDSAPPSDDTTNFSRAAVRLLPAEVLLDAISQVLEVSDRFRFAPQGLRAVQLPGIAAGHSFLKIFGKPERLLTCECERSEATTLAQAFQMINGEVVRGKLESDENRLARRIREGRADNEILEELMLAALARYPTSAEEEGLLGHVRRGGGRLEAWQDVAWAILNSKEFLLRH